MGIRDHGLYAVVLKVPIPFLIVVILRLPVDDAQEALGPGNNRNSHNQELNDA